MAVEDWYMQALLNIDIEFLKLICFSKLLMVDNQIHFQLSIVDVFEVTEFYDFFIVV